MNISGKMGWLWKLAKMGHIIVWPIWPGWDGLQTQINQCISLCRPYRSKKLLFPGENDNRSDDTHNRRSKHDSNPKNEAANCSYPRGTKFGKYGIPSNHSWSWSSCHLTRNVFPVSFFPIMVYDTLQQEEKEKEKDTIHNASVLRSITVSLRCENGVR